MTVTNGVNGAYANPASDTSALIPANSLANVTLSQTGTASVPAKWLISLRAYRGRAVAIHWDYNGLDVSVNGTPIFTDLPTPGFVPAAGNKFAFSARTESSNSMDMFLDDVDGKAAVLSTRAAVDHDLHFRRVAENHFPRIANGGAAGQDRAVRMNAVDIVVRGPHRLPGLKEGARNVAHKHTTILAG